MSAAFEAVLPDLGEGITTSVQLSPRRRKIDAEVQPGGRHVVYRVPTTGATPEALADFVRRTRARVLKWAREYQEIDCFIVSKQLIGGEGFGFMGRNHRLNIVDDAAVPVEAVTAPTWSHKSWWLNVRRADLNVRTIIEWYRQQGQAWLDRHVPALAARAGVPVGPGGLVWEVRPYRAGDCASWASCHGGRLMRVHWVVFQFPREWVEHVVKHELSHARTDDGHGPGWQSAMDRLAGPDWRQLEQWVKTGRKQTLWDGTQTPTAEQVAMGEVERHFQRYTSEQRANRAASHRLGPRQRQAIGETFFTHPAVPGKAFATPREAAQAAVRATTPTKPAPTGDSDEWAAVAAALIEVTA